MRILFLWLMIVSLASCNNVASLSHTDNPTILPEDTQTRKSTMLGEGYVSCRLAEISDDTQSDDSKFVVSFSESVQQSKLGELINYEMQEYLYLEVNGTTLPCLFYHAEPAIGNGFERKAIVDFGYKLKKGEKFNVYIKDERLSFN